MDSKDVLAIIFPIVSMIGMIVMIMINVFVFWGKIQENFAKMKDEYNKSLDEVKTELHKCVGGLKDDVAEIKTDVAVQKREGEIYWATVERKMAEQIKNSPEDSEYDLLLTKFTKRTLTYDEAMSLKKELENKLTDDKDKQFGYIMILGRLAVVIDGLRERTCNESRIVDSIR